MSMTTYTQPAGNGALPVPTAVDQSSKGVARIVQWAESAQAAHQLAEILCQTSFCPEQFRDKPGECTAAILAGGEVGLSPMASMQAFDIIQGRAAARAITLRAVVQSFGHEVELVESSAARCRMRGRRKGSTGWQEVTWTIERARNLGLTTKGNWKSQPTAMLLARATSEICRLVAADAILGIGYAAEELEDLVAEQQPAGGRKVQRQTAPPKAAIAPPEPVQDDDDLLGDGEPAPAQKAAEPPPAPVTPAQLRMLGVTWGSLGVTEDAERHEYTRILIGRDFGDTTKNLTKPEAIALINQLTDIRRDVFGEDTRNPDAEDQRRLREGLEKLISERAEP